MLLCGDVLEQLSYVPDETVQCCITSPPYWGLRDYGVGGQIGLESTPEAYVNRLVEVFREVGRVLKPDGTVWLNLGDSYAATHTGTLGTGKRSDSFHFDQSRLEQQGKNRRKEQQIPDGLKPKDLVGIPWRVAFALQSDGWYLRSDIIWAKPNVMPESVRDRCTRSHEYIFLLSRSEKYSYNADSIREPNKTCLPVVRKERSQNRHPQHGDLGDRPVDSFGSLGYNPLGKNKRDVWVIPTRPFKGAHFATFPEELVKTCMLAGSATGDIVLDPFCGSGTVGKVAKDLGREFIGIDLNPDYIEMSRKRIGEE